MTLQYTDASRTIIDVGYGRFIPVADDNEEYRAIAAKVTAGTLSIADPPSPPAPSVITVSQAKRQLLAMGLMTPDEALANDIPAFLKTILDQMVGNKQASQAADVAIRWHNATEWLRDDPLFAGGLLAAAAQTLNVPANDATLDQFFTAAAAL